MSRVVTRFAPSPTGYLHIGGARTCLFSWLYARHHQGKFILRIEDTDRERSKKEYLEDILNSLKWLGIDYDELHFQSHRLEIYRRYADRLIQEGKAYIKEGAVFFRYETKSIKMNDLIRGEIIFEELPKEEEVIIKKDGTPTYNFACVVDDALMGVNFVIRGDDHISNTPKQILMYEALNFPLPNFAHVPLILSPEGGRMSKRYGATSINEYKNMGYLGEAINNYLLLLGWSPSKDREIISLEEAINIFDICNVNKTAATFSLDKLNWLNTQYIRLIPVDDLTERVKTFLREKGFLTEDVDDEYLKRVVNLLRERIVTLDDFTKWGRFCFYDDYTYAEDTKDILSLNLSNQIQELIKVLEDIDGFTKDNIEARFRELAVSLGLKARDLVHPVRVALTGSRVGPGLFETMEVLGKDRVIKRLRRLIDYWKS